MSIEYRKALREAIENHPDRRNIVASITDKNITYNPAGVRADPAAPGFSGATTSVSDEELVRAYLLLRLAGENGYAASHEVLEVGRVYGPVGRPTGKGGRADVLVRYPASQGGAAFLFIECKTQATFDRDLKHLEGQLFRLSLQEQPRPKYLLYYTVELREGCLNDRLILIDTGTFATFEAWDAAGQPITGVIPPRYNRPTVQRYANVPAESKSCKPLDKSATPAVFSRLRDEIHDVVWGGGGTNNNEVFVYIVKLLLCKIYDEAYTAPGDQFEYQRLGDVTEPKPPSALADRLNDLYRRAERAYLAMPSASEGPAFDPARISSEKLAYVVGRLESLSITENMHPGDILSEFFEQIVSQDFTQTKGQFFTPIKVVRFMLALCDAAGQADRTMRAGGDAQGRPRLPYVIDPSCGSGTFLIEYMKTVTGQLGGRQVAEELPNRIRETHAGWFGSAPNAWAKDQIFGIENNHDLGLSAKVNMVLHGDGSMNTWITSGLRPFDAYLREGQSNVLGVSDIDDEQLYNARTNSQFDLVISNPPFSIAMSPDETRELRNVFTTLAASPSELLFVERWYQLLREGGRFCCVLPETILDTRTNLSSRLFLYRFFRIHAVVSLPYSAFQPFTGTKTCIVLAEKRKQEESKRFSELWSSYRNTLPGPRERFSKVIDEIGWSVEPIFMAEPESVGYKRRKGLPDVHTANDLYTEQTDGEVDSDADAHTVLKSYLSAGGLDPSPVLGFWTNLKNVSRRDFLRLDPKYRWLWDYQKGVVHGARASASPLSTILELADLSKVDKGPVKPSTLLIDLEQVESRQALLKDNIPAVDRVGSQKVRFLGCELAISKLEPYLGKVLISPPGDALGSTEWAGLNNISDLPLDVVAYLLMLPELCEAYRRLQSGKRHARLDPKELLDLRVELPSLEAATNIRATLVDARNRIVDLRQQQEAARASIDALFGSDPATS